MSAQATEAAGSRPSRRFSAAAVSPGCPAAALTGVVYSYPAGRVKPGTPVRTNVTGGTVGWDAAAALATPSGRPPRTGPGVRLQGLERCGRRGLDRAAVRRGRARRPALRHGRPGGVLRLPDHAADDPDARGASAGGAVARGRDLLRPGPARAARPGPAGRRRAVLPLARVLR